MPKRPFLMFAIVFIVLMALMQFLAYQQYKISEQQRSGKLIDEAAAVKDRFRNILVNDFAAANTLAIIFKEYGVSDKFDSIASQILKNSRYAQALQITENGIVKNVYPDSPYNKTIGTNVNTDPIRKAEEMSAVGRRDIYFAGPRRLRFGDTGILGKVAILEKNNIIAVATVLTRLPLLRKVLEPSGTDKGKFAYRLLKVQDKDTLSFALSDTKPARNNEYIDIEVPEGNWVLRLSYSDGYIGDKFPYELSGLGILLSFFAGLAAYRKTLEPDKLKRIIDEKTDQLAKSEKYFRTLIETSSDAIVLLDTQGKVLYQTPSAEKILGYTLPEMLKMDGLALIHPDDRAKDNSMFEELVSNPGSIIHRSHRIKRKNGSYIQIEGTYRNLLHDKNVKALVYNYKDVTDKMLSEESLLRYNRELGLLNKINDIILRVSDEFQLYEEVCDCIFKIGNYPLVWICHKPDAGASDQTVVPLVAAGATGHMKGARIVLDDPELSNGPTGMALNTGKIVISNCVAHATYFSKFIESANELGIRSLAALPLNFGDDKSGALIMYSGRVNAFDENEVSTLSRLAANLSLAVQHIQNRGELVESENRFRRAFEDSAIGMGLTSIEEGSMGRWLQVNRSLCEMLGYTEDELTAMTFMQITHPEDLGRDLAAQDRVLQGEADTYRLEKRYIRKDGGFNWINLNVSVVKDKDKRPLYLVAQVENITEKIESQTQFQNLVEHFIVGVYIIQDYKLVYVNPRVIEETGYTEKEIIGMPFDKFIYPEDLEFVSGIVDTRIKEGLKTVRYEARIKQKSGEPLWCEILGGSTYYHGAPALIGTMINISERKAVYDELKSSEAKLKSIFDTTDVGYLLLDRNYSIVALNQHMKDVYIDAAGVVLCEGAALMELIPPGNRGRARASYDEVVKGNKAVDYETTYFKQGAGMHFLANVKPIVVGEKVTGICISSMDITERKNALEQLKKVNEDLQEQARELATSNAELEQFAYVASHDLQEPLRMVTSFLTQLETKYGDILDEKAKQYIYFATDGAKRMRQLILDLLEYSRVGRTGGNLVNVDVNNLVKEVLIFFQRNIEETNACVHLDDLPTVRAYKTPVRQVFQNLIGNALKYHKPGTVPIIEIACTESETAIEFIVSDNGIGIDAEYFDQIFIIFKRLHNRDEYAGTGMGLAITKKIIEHMGGKIWVSSREGEGSAFHFTIPKYLH